MRSPDINRRQVLAAMGAFAGALAPARSFASDSTLTFEELYGSFGVLGLTFSDKVRTLDGGSVSMRGFMAPPLKAEANFFVLTKVPVSLCPFCSSDADWPDDIVVIYLNRARTFEQANGLIEVSGTLETGSWTDPETGFVSLLRIVGADFHKV